MGRGEGWGEVPCFPLVGSVDGYVVSYNAGVTQTRFWPTLCKIKLVSISCRDKKLKFLLFIKVPTPFSPFGVVQSQKTKGNILRTLDNG